MPARSTLASLAVAALLLLTFAPPATAGPDSCATDVATRVQHRYDGVRDLRGRFEQRTERAALGGKSEALVARGEAIFAKPGKMRWVYESPEPSLVVSDGQTLWIYDEKAREVQRLPLAEGQLSAAGVQFLLGEGDLQKEFAITATGCDAPAVALALVPKRDAQYERIELVVDSRSAAIRETTVVDLFGNRTTVRFEDLRENTSPAAKLFQFEPAAGVRIIDLAPPR